MSNKADRPSFNIGRYLQTRGYKIYPVNPVLKEVHGVACYKTLSEADAACRAETGEGIDLVDVFRAPEFVPAIVDEVIALGIKNLWLQDGVTHDEAEAKARAAGVNVVSDDCIYRRLMAVAP
jgi:predicted CoA-binding protein